MPTTSLAVILRVAMLLALFEAGVSTSRSAADVVVVPPGAGTLQAAIDAATSGSRLHLQDGVYGGAVVLTKSLKIRCFGASVCVIDAGCAAPIAFDVAANDVSIEGKTAVTQIIGGTTTELRVSNSANVRLRGLQLHQAQQAPCGTETTSIEVGTSSRVSLNDVHGFYGAFIHDIQLAARLSIKSSTLVGKRALLIQDSGGPGTGSGAIRVIRSAIQADPDGIAPDEVAVELINSDGVRIKSNVMSDQGAGAIGIALDASSDGNLILRNRWAGGAGNTPYVDNGTDNCAKKNYSDPGNLPFVDSCS